MLRLTLTLFVIAAVFTAGLILSSRALAHNVTRSDCVSVARYTVGSRAVKRAAAAGCRRYAAAHALDHKHVKCQSLRGGYRVRNACTIRVVFGAFGAAAVRIARCESGLSVGARNGQYLGLFQMGTSERLTYGHGNSARGQSEAAWRYFAATGRDWSPWACG